MSSGVGDVEGNRPGLLEVDRTLPSPQPILQILEEGRAGLRRHLREFTLLPAPRSEEGKIGLHGGELSYEGFCHDLDAGETGSSETLQDGGSVLEERSLRIRPRASHGFAHLG